MEPSCEVCESFCPEASLRAGRALVAVSCGERRVLLCRGHAGIARNSGASTLDDLRALYAESAGQRSYIARRAERVGAETARVRNAGRRVTDLVR